MRFRILPTLPLMLLLSILHASPALAGQAFIKTTVPNVPNSPCQTVGSISMEFSSGTIFHIGDQIQFTLESYSTLCRTVDFFLTLEGGRAHRSGEGYFDSENSIYMTGNSPSTTMLEFYGSTPDFSASPVAPAPYFATNGTDSDTFGNNAVAETGFRVYGEKDSPTLRVTFGYINASYKFIGSNSTDGGFAADFSDPVVRYISEDSEKLVITLFDKKADPYWFRRGSSGTYYYSSTVQEVNMQCIDITQYDGADEYIQTTPDSIPTLPAYKLTFSGDYTIARITGDYEYNIDYACPKRLIPFVPFTSTVKQDVFENTGTFDIGTYNNGTITGSNLCSSSNPNLIAVTAPQGFIPGQEYLLYFNVSINGPQPNPDIQPQVSMDSSTVKFYTATQINVCGQKLTPFTDFTNEHNSGTYIYRYFTLPNKDIRAIVIDVPELTFENVSENQTLRVSVSLSPADSCGVDAYDVLTVANFVPSCENMNLYTEILPYLTGPQDPDGFWSGVSFTNMSDSYNTITFTLYDASGGSGTRTIGMNPHSIQTYTMNDIFWMGGILDLDPTKRFSIIATGTKPFEATAMIGHDEKGLLHGYMGE